MSTAPSPRTTAMVTLREARAQLRHRPDGRGELTFALPTLRCGGCVAAVEKAVGTCPDVVSARANLTLKRVRIVLDGTHSDIASVIASLEAAGFPPVPLESSEDDDVDTEGRRLIQAVAVAGFGTMNIMLLSVAVWSGADGAYREAFHLISAFLAVLVVAYAGQPFFRSAAGALRARRLNMDVPIALAVLLSLVFSLVETGRGGEHVFFDAAVMLLFFLLIGRALEHRMRERARSAVTGLARLIPSTATIRGDDGALTDIALADLTPGMTVVVGAGERVPVDMTLTNGATDVDRSLITGESMPVPAGKGAFLEAGALNLTGTVDGTALRAADQSFLAEMMAMVQAVESARGPGVRLADRVARAYAPVVHVLALATFAGWMLATGDFQHALFVAIATLIITCPCALGLAVPVANVIAAAQLMRAGVLVKDGSALERLSEIDHAVFDKTGTLTTGNPVASGGPDDLREMAVAETLARASSHPASQAIAAGARHPEVRVAASVREIPGFGVEGVVDGQRARLGRPDWVAEIARAGAEEAGPAFAMDGGAMTAFRLNETVRRRAATTVAALGGRGVSTSMLSGDDPRRARNVAEKVRIADVHAGATPEEKVAYLNTLRADGRCTLMVGDGLNDTAALRAADVSMAPASAFEAGRAAADFVFLGEGLDAVAKAHDVARRTAAIVRQNLALALAYNTLAIPIAVAGFVTPLVAAVAMSSSSILVIANSLRLNRSRKEARADLPFLVARSAT